MKVGLLSLATLAIASLMTVPAAGSTWMGSGSYGDGGGTDYVKATADFEVVNGSVQLTLTNVSGTVDKASLLTGVVFNGTFTSTTASNVSLTSATTGGQLYTSATSHSSSNANFAVSSTTGGYQLVNSAFSLSGANGVSGNYQYGIATIGGNVWNGNQVGNDNYGLVGDDTVSQGYLGNNDFKNQFPYLDNSLTFTLANFSAADINNITSVGFVYGSGPEALIAGSNTPGGPAITPEPGSAAILFSLTSAGGVVSAARRLRLKRA